MEQLAGDAVSGAGVVSPTAQAPTKPSVSEPIVADSEMEGVEKLVTVNGTAAVSADDMETAPLAAEEIAGLAPDVTVDELAKADLASAVEPELAEAEEAIGVLTEDLQTNGISHETQGDTDLAEDVAEATGEAENARAEALETALETSIEDSAAELSEPIPAAPVGELTDSLTDDVAKPYFASEGADDVVAVPSGEVETESDTANTASTVVSAEGIVEFAAVAVAEGSDDPVPEPIPELAIESNADINISETADSTGIVAVEPDTPAAEEQEPPAVEELEIPSPEPDTLAVEELESPAVKEPEVPAGAAAAVEAPEVPAGADAAVEKPEVPAGADAAVEVTKVPAGADAAMEEPEVPALLDSLPEDTEPVRDDTEPVEADAVPEEEEATANGDVALIADDNSNPTAGIAVAEEFESPDRQKTELTEDKRPADSGESEMKGPVVAELVANTYSTIKTKPSEAPTRPPPLASQSPKAFSPHDTINTANVHEILQKGSFAKEPLVDFIPYEELKTMRLEDGIDVTRKEGYLGDEEFAKVFGLSRDEFSKLPVWKRQQKKKTALLF